MLIPGSKGAPRLGKWFRNLKFVEWLHSRIRHPPKSPVILFGELLARPLRGLGLCLRSIGGFLSLGRCLSLGLGLRGHFGLRDGHAAAAGLKTHGLLTP